MFHSSPRCLVHTWYSGSSLPGRDTFPKKPNTKSLASRAPTFGVKCFHSLAPCLRKEVQDSFGKRLTELQKAITEPEGCQDEANMGRIYQCRSQRKISKLAFNMLWSLIGSFQTSWCGATTLRFKNQAQEVILLSTEGTIRGIVGLCGYVLFTETGARACKVKTEERKRFAKWIRAQDEKIQGLWEKEMEDPEDCHLERKGLAYVRKWITLPEAKAIKSRKQELSDSLLFFKMEVALLFFEV